MGLDSRLPLFEIQAFNPYGVIAVLPHEQIYLSRLPTADMYEKSYMHRDTLNFIAVTK